MKNSVLRKPLSLLLALVMVLSLLPASAFAAAQPPTAVEELLTAISNSYQSTAGDWAAMDMAAYGRGNDVAGATIVQNARETYANGSTTDLARAVITLTALGVDAKHIYGGSEGQYLDFVAKMCGSAPAQTPQAIFGLLALDSGEYDDTGLALNRQSYKDFLLDSRLDLDDGQTAWAIGGSAPDVDVTGMAVASLAPYYTSDAAVQSAVDEALAFLSAEQNALGHCGNSNSTAMVIVALAALGLDPGAADGDFAKDGGSLIDGLLAFRTSTDQFGFDSGETANALSTEQGFRALVAYRGYLSGAGAYSVYQFGPQTGDGTALTGETDPGPTPPDPGTAKGVTVRIENLYTGGTLMPQTGLAVSGSHLDALKGALAANGYDAETDLILSSYGYVDAILGVVGEADNSTAWMYTMNGKTSYESLGEAQVEEGDRLLLYFSEWNDAVYLTGFDRETVDIKAGESVALTLTGVLPWEGDYAPISGATVYALDATGNEVGISATTDGEGKTTLTFPTAGTYTVSAKRQGAVNATNLVPPLCAVTVAPPTAPPEPDDVIAVSFTLRGLDSANREQTWIDGKTVANMDRGATVADAIVKAMANSGYTQRGAQSGYVKSVTTPDGVTLGEMEEGMPNSGWLYRVNGKLPTVGMDSYGVKDGDHILLYFTMDYTADPDAGTGSDEISATPKEETVPKEETAPWENPFGDVAESDWFYDAVRYANANHLMAGTATDAFSPHAPMTRGMLATVLYHQAGEPPVAGTSPFADVAGGQWYANAALWAWERGIVAGYDDGSFGPDDPVTREQIAVILWHYIHQLGVTTEKKAELSAYGDEDEISPWALEAMQWAKAENLLNGRSATTLAPRETATRAEVAAILMYLLENVVE